MSTKIRLSPMRKVTSYAPLGVLGYCLSRNDFLQPVFAEVQLGMKSVAYTPQAKLVDLLVSILVGCRAIAQVNTCLRPDEALAQAWGRKKWLIRFARAWIQLRFRDVLRALRDELGIEPRPLVLFLAVNLIKFHVLRLMALRALVMKRPREVVAVSPYGIPWLPAAAKLLREKPVNRTASAGGRYETE